MRKVWHWTKRIVLFFFLSTMIVVLLYRFIPVYVTPLMLIRSVEQLASGQKVEWHHHWVPIEKMSRYMPMAVIASEDNRYMTHHGFDFEELKKVIKKNKHRKRPRGASTITQQTAKNVFLWPGHSYVRKGLEAYFTVLIELFWGKERIMEVYLNSIETGKGIYGVEAVAQQHFHKTAARLTRSQCALIAATLPNPRRFNSAAPSGYMLRRQSQIVSLMGKIAPVDFTK
ncbi:monofunctional biosynthetic peptidoglycan transglycosylase [Barnesiella sp. An55]|uniref:monofunctional biosynthetic peptidoglycan transglycosylase n=1 Tax=Barnesiella sp. An55 TaxID=1965646 RepID=UPI000B36CE2D|nr:monofunctional biosynthetic peptidoglycan transglycosylase [Barnesiella sp. An55]OUN74862.1 monofunctional biosynthetic peptidoglycan transglycosylase [Barnesiella sp. An55]HIZ27047.1 monofunctional biosynthetic peptidoglycan transglycosylase [Candidatus Barnesiella merdipullorum]